MRTCNHGFMRKKFRGKCKYNISIENSLKAFHFFEKDQYLTSKVFNSCFEETTHFLMG